MRTPLNAVLGYTRLALEGENGPATAEYLEKIQRAGNILLSLINDTLDLSKIETGAIMTMPVPLAPPLAVVVEMETTLGMTLL